MSLPSGTPFVVFGDDWGRSVSTMQHVFRHIAARYPVLWLNGIGHRVPRLRTRDLRRAWEKLRAMAGPAPRPAPIPDRLGGAVPAAILEPRVLPWHHRRAVYAFNTAVLLRTIRRGLRRLELDRPPVLVTGSPPSAGVVGRLGELASVYYCMDDFLHFPTVEAAMIAPLERQLLERVDLMVATAASLTETKVPRSGRVHHLPQGVNYDHFAEPMPVPDDLSGLPGPRIGFAGSVSTQCDVDVMVQLAEAHPNGSLVLVGPVSLGDGALARLRRPNVHFLGVRPYDQLPAYVQHVDVGIIPYVLSGWTKAVDPLKALEYLAAGIPVVMSDIPEARKYGDVAAVTSSAEGFVAAVAAALTRDRVAGRERGRAFARRHTWAHRAEEFLALIERIIAEKGGGTP